MGGWLDLHTIRLLDDDVSPPEMRPFLRSRPRIP